MSSSSELPGDARRLQAFIGTWIVRGALLDDEERYPIAGEWTFQSAADGFGVSGTMTTEIEGSGSLAERELIGYDFDSGLIHMFSMNRLAIRDHIGGWHGETLVARYTSSDGTTEEEFRVRFPEPDRMLASVAEHTNGRLTLTTELTLHRVQSASQSDTSDSA